MAFTTNPYCQLSDVKGALGITSTTNDTWIASLIPLAQQAIDTELGYSFQSDGSTRTPSTYVYSAADSDYLFTGWISQITQVLQTSYSIAVNYAGSYTVAPTTQQDITADCYIGPDNRNPGWKLGRMSGFSFVRGRMNYSVSGVFGFSVVPLDIVRACTRLVVAWVKMRDTNYADVLAEQGAVRQKYSKKIPDDVQEILDNYYIRRFYSR